MPRLWLDLQAAAALCDQAVLRDDPNDPDPPTVTLAPGMRPRLVLAHHGQMIGLLPAIHTVPDTRRLHRRRANLDSEWTDLHWMRIRLHARARAGHHWLILDGPTTATAVYRDTTLVPATARWIPAQVATGRLGPYPAEIAAGYRHHGAAVARFTRDTAVRIVADIRALNPPPLRHLTAEFDPDRQLVHLITRTAYNAVHHARLTAESDGWFRINHPHLAWQPRRRRHDAPAGRVPHHAP